MIRSKCPKCANALTIPDAQAGGISSCPECGQKFRVPAAAKKAGSGPPEGAVQASTPPPKPHRPPSDDFPANPDVGELIDDDQHTEEEVPVPRKRKKKKRKASQASSINVLHIIAVVGGLAVIVLATMIFFALQHRGAGRSKSKVNPELVLGRLQDMGARVRRDMQSPDQQVIEIAFNGEYDPKILKDLVAFPELRKVSLAGTPTTDVWLEWIEDVTQLTALDLGHTKVTGGGMQFLRKMVNLEELGLVQTLVDDHRLMELKGCKKLKNIYLDGSLASGLSLKEVIPDLVIHK
jgi:hypothetical protein